MKALKKPVIAVILALAIIVSSSLLSAGAKLRKECQAVTDGFFKGVEYNGYKHSSIFSQLQDLCAAVSGLITVAKNNNVDASRLSVLNSELDSSISAMHDRISSIYELYGSLLASLRPVLDGLSELSLSRHDAKELAQYTEAIKRIENTVSEAGYNETVCDYISGIDPVEHFFITVTGAKLPEKFSAA